MTHESVQIDLPTQQTAVRLEAMGTRALAERVHELAARGKRAPHEAPALFRRADELEAAAATLARLIEQQAGKIDEAARKIGGQK